MLRAELQPLSAALAEARRWRICPKDASQSIGPGFCLNALPHVERAKPRCQSTSGGRFPARSGRRSARRTESTRALLNTVGLLATSRSDTMLVRISMLAVTVLARAAQGEASYDLVVLQALCNAKLASRCLRRACAERAMMHGLLDRLEHGLSLATRNEDGTLTPESGLDWMNQTSYATRTPRYTPPNTAWAGARLPVES